jgi:putative flippase GtrA
MIFNFVFSNFWTFKAGTQKQTAKIGKYLVIATINYLLDTLVVFPFLTGILKMNQYLAKILITALIVMWNFFIYKFWVFKTSAPVNNP